METVGLNIEFPIYFDVDGVQTPFYDLVLKKPTYTSVVMSLGDKIVGDVYYKDNKIDENEVMSAYIVYNDVRYALVNPPTIVREGLVSDNGELKGMTKYSFEFYHPMSQLSNLTFSDVAVSSDELAYKSQDKTFAWIGYLADFAAKLNKNLQNTEWVVVVNDTVPSDKSQKMSEVLSFDKNTIADALKTCYDTWEVPFIIDKLERNQYYDGEKNDYYSQGKRFVILFGLPSNEITSGIIAQSDISCDTYSYGYNFIYNNPISLNKGDIVTLTNFTGSSPRFITNPQGAGDVYDGLQYVATENIDIYIGNNGSPATCTYTIARSFVFRFGQGVGLKNNSRTPKNNKIVTRIAGYGSENNIPYGYPQIVWTGDQDWDYTINNASGVQTVEIDGETRSAMSYPIYKGIVGGQYVKLIKHPFTRTHLMPSVYVDRVNKKVNPDAEGYNPDIEIIDYYDADSSYPNPINPIAPSYEIHEFEDEKPELGEKALYDVSPYDDALKDAITVEQCKDNIQRMITTGVRANNKKARESLSDILTVLDIIETIDRRSDEGAGGSFSYKWEVSRVGHENYATVVYSSNGGINFDYTVLVGDEAIIWDDTMNDEGEYIQSYFQITLPILDFDLYACAAITQEMSINMRSGACLGCTFNVQVDWDDYKKNFYKENGEFDPVPHTEQGDGHVRDANKYPLSNQTRITLIVQKDLNTFGTIMPNSYQTIKKNDKFVILGISLPTSYITRAEQRLDDDMREYMLENNIYYYDYPIKFDEYFLAQNADILAQIRNNTTLRFEYANVTCPLYIKEMSIKWGQSPLPQYDITLSDDIEIVLNKIGQVTDDVSRMRVQVSQLANYLGVSGSSESTGITFEKLQEEFNKKLSKVADDIAEGRITFQQGLTSLGSAIFNEDISSSDFMSGLYGGRGWKIDKVGGAEFESIRVRSFLEIVELLVNRMQAQEGDTLFSDNDQIESVFKETNSYVLTLKEKWHGYITAQQYGNILKGIVNTLAAKQGNVSDVDEDESGTVKDGQNSYYTSWMRVTDTHDTDNTLGINQIRVVLYSDSETPTNKNFEPCELMNVARWGCVDYSDSASEDYEQVLASIKRRQQSFYISSSDGRIVKLRGVSKPKLEAANYGTVLGIVPDFVREWASISARIQSDRDYLYAQGVIVEDFIKVNSLGLPVINYVDCGEWIDGSTITPTVGNGIYLVEEYSDVNLQYETHEVWHNGEKWRCVQHQPIIENNVEIYEEPSEESTSWLKLITKGENGRSAAYYNEQEYAWSSKTEADSVYSYPSDITAWTTYIPSKDVSKPYLWMRMRRFTWNSNTNSYVPGAYSYARLSGEDGTGIQIKGGLYAVADSISSLPTSGVPTYSYAIITNQRSIYVWTDAWNIDASTMVNTGDCYILQSDGHGWIWNGANWQDVGQIKGADGYNSYIHVAWAHAIDPTLGYPTDGMGFTIQKSATEIYEYMGVYADQNAADSTTPSDYEWNEVKGFDAPITKKSADSVLYRTDSNGVIVGGGSQSVAVEMFIQGRRAVITEVAILEKPSIYITTATSISEGTANITITVSSSLTYNYLGAISFLVRGTLDGVTYTAYDTIMVAENRVGADSIVLDLDNENDSILYKADGSDAISEKPESTWYLYKGGNDISSLVTRNATKCTLVATNCTATWTAKTGTKRYRTFMVSDLTDKQGSVIVRVAYDGTTYEKTFSVTKLVGVDKFDILCSPNAVTYNTTTGNGSSRSVNVRIYHTDANAGTREIVTSLSDAGLYLYVYPEGATPTATNYRCVDGTHYKGASGYTFTADTSYNAYHVLLLKALYNASTYPQNTIDAETIPISKSADGTSILVADLTNEMDSVALTSDGQAKVTTTLTTTAKIYFGTTEETQTVAPTTTIQKSGVTFSSNINGVITITVAQGTTFTNDKLVIPITVKCAKGERNVDFTITGVRAGKDGSFTMYQLDPTVDLIKVSKDGVLSREGFICNLLRTTEQGTSTVYRMSLPSRIEIRYAINEEVAKDNQTIYANSDGVVADGTIVNSSTTIGAFNVRNIYAVEEKGYGHFLTLYLYDGNLLVDRETIPFVIDGKNGDNGKMGRSFYYKGDWIEGTGDTFNVTDYEAPFFTYNNQKWVWVGANGTNIPVNSTNRPSNSNANWEIMVADFNYLITKAFFTEFANLGSWYFNGDYMFSNKGYDANGNITYFTSGGRFYGEGSPQNTYTPVTFINAATGTIHTSDIYANNSTFENINLTGVINNLIQNITIDNYQNFFYYEAYRSVYWINPLKIGNVVSLASDAYVPHSIMLPCAFRLNNENHILGTKENGTPFTLSEIRQCVGKKIYLIPPINNAYTTNLYCGYDVGTRLLAVKKTSWGSENDLSRLQENEEYEKNAKIQMVYSWEGHYAAHYQILECKLGRYEDYECIYWELEDVATALS